MHQIIAQLEFCGIVITEEEKLEKIFSTFHASQVLLQQQYRMRGFTEYSDMLLFLWDVTGGFLLIAHYFVSPLEWLRPNQSTQ
jgi:hypothetical protein